jgi:hypothetical protein
MSSEPEAYSIPSTCTYATPRRLWGAFRAINYHMKMQANVTPLQVQRMNRVQGVMSMIRETFPLFQGIQMPSMQARPSRTTLDLHGHTEETARIVRRFLRHMAYDPSIHPSIQIITGYGAGRPGFEPKLKPLVAQELQRIGLESAYRIINNGGCFWIPHAALRTAQVRAALVIQPQELEVCIDASPAPLEGYHSKAMLWNRTGVYDICCRVARPRLLLNGYLLPHRAILLQSLGGGLSFEKQPGGARYIVAPSVQSDIAFAQLAAWWADGGLDLLGLVGVVAVQHLNRDRDHDRVEIWVSAAHTPDMVQAAQRAIQLVCGCVDAQHVPHPQH